MLHVYLLPVSRDFSLSLSVPLLLHYYVVWQPRQLLDVDAELAGFSNN